MSIMFVLLVSMVFEDVEVVSLFYCILLKDLSDMFDNGDPYDIIYFDFEKPLIKFHIVFKIKMLLHHITSK